MQFAMKKVFHFFAFLLMFYIWRKSWVELSEWAEQFLMEYYGNEKWKYEKEIIIFVCYYNYFHHFRLTNYVMFFFHFFLTPPPYSLPSPSLNSTIVCFKHNFIHFLTH